MYQKIILFSSLILFGGCAIKDDPNIQQLFKEDEIYHTSLNNTKKAQLIASLETKALLTATYLNPVFGGNKSCKNMCVYVRDGEYFFIGIFITDSEKHEFNKKGYALTLNGRKPSNIELLEENDPLRYQMPMVNNWSSYYKVKFPIMLGNDMNLTFENDRFGKDVLTFSKNQKPLFAPLKYLNTLRN